MEHVRIGGRLFVEDDALESFFKALANADLEHFDRHGQAPTPTTTIKPATAHQREREIAAAEARLVAAGA